MQDVCMNAPRNASQQTWHTAPRSRLADFQRMLLLVLIAVLAGCGAPTERRDAGADVPPTSPMRMKRLDQAPKRFTIVPDDYHVPYAGIAEDGRKFFLSDELFSYGTPDAPGSSYVGLFLWNADGTFSEVKVDEVARPDGLPPGQAGPSGAEDLVEARLAELGDYKLAPIEVEPFTETVDGVTFGWKVGQYEDGTYYINIEPGNFIAYHEPWDGVEYDT